jgi:hypothetical protein
VGYHQQEAGVVATVEEAFPSKDAVAAVGARGGPQQGPQGGHWDNQQVPKTRSGRKKIKSREPHLGIGWIVCGPVSSYW